MKILHLDLGRDFRGGQRQVLYLHQELRHRGYDSCLACPQTSPLAQKAEGFLLGLPSRWEWDFRNLLLVRKFCLQNKVDIIHTHDSRSAALGAILRACQLGCRLVHTRRVSYPLGKGWSFYKYSLGDKVVAVSQDIGKGLQNSGIAPDKLEVVHSAIDLASYKVRKFSPVINRIGVIGALTSQKGHEIFIRALAECKDVLADREVWLVGQGKLQESLQQLCLELGLKVVFRGYQESLEVLPHLDLLVVPSVNGEGSCGVVKEAWASNIPVLVSDLAANLELVQDQVSGIVFKSRDICDLARKLRYCLQAGKSLSYCTEQGRQMVHNFSVSQMGDRYISIYDNLVVG